MINMREHFEKIRTAVLTAQKLGYQVGYLNNLDADGVMCPMAMARAFDLNYNPPYLFIIGFVHGWDGCHENFRIKPRDDYHCGIVVAKALRQYLNSARDNLYLRNILRSCQKNNIIEGVNAKKTKNDKAYHERDYGYGFFLAITVG